MEKMCALGIFLLHQKSLYAIWKCPFVIYFASFTFYAHAKRRYYDRTKNNRKNKIGKHIVNMYKKIPQNTQDTIQQERGSVRKSSMCWSTKNSPRFF